MGILDKIFGSSSNDDKWVIFAALSIALARSDGDVSIDERYFSSKYIQEKSNMSDSQCKKIFEKAMKIDQPLLKISKLNNDDLAELFQFLIELAFKDGEVHEKEFLLIIWCGVYAGVDIQVLTDILIGRNIANIDECKKLFKKTQIEASKNGIIVPNVSFDTPSNKLANTPSNKSANNRILRNKSTSELDDDNKSQGSDKSVLDLLS